jgi:hypothetical protein
MQRWHAERDLMLRRWREEIAKHESDEGYSYCALAPVPPTADEDSCHCYLGMGFMRKRRPHDCGNPRCMLCHLEKYYYPKNRANKRRAAIRQDLLAAGHLGS